MTIKEVKERADSLIDIFKQGLIDYGDVMPQVIAISGEETFWFALAEYTSRDIYRTVAKNLALLHADYGVIVNDAYMKVYPAGPEGDKALKNYKKGDYSVDPEAKESLIIAIKERSTKKSYSKTFPYIRNEVGDIVFEVKESQWMEGQINILPDWWDDHLLVLAERVGKDLKQRGESDDKLVQIAITQFHKGGFNVPEAIVRRWVKSI